MNGPQEVFAFSESLYREGFLESPSRASLSDSWKPEAVLSGSSSASSLEAAGGPALVDGSTYVFDNATC